MKEKFTPYTGPNYSAEEMTSRSIAFRNAMEHRRSLRFFSDKPVSKQVVENLLMTASSAPSGAHKQPWTFCAVSSDIIKGHIKKAAEEEEFENYNGRMSEEWLKDLEVFDTDWHKPFLTTAPWLIIVFKKAYDIDNGEKKKNYYVNESVGIASGFLLTAIHHAGLVSLTHTPSPMNFLQKVLNRPDNERPYLLIPIGYPAEDAVVPVLDRKGMDEVVEWYE